MDGPMERLHSGLDICVMAPTMGDVDGVSTIVVWGRVGMPWYLHVAYLSQHQYMIFSSFTISKTYTYYVFEVYIYYKKEHWWFLALPWLGVTREGFRPTQYVLKKSYYPQIDFIRFVSIMLIISIYCYIVLYHVIHFIRLIL